METLKVKINNEFITISRKGFLLLLDNYTDTMSTEKFKECMREGVFTIGYLKDISKNNEIPLPLFFADYNFVKKQNKQVEKNINEGLSKIPDVKHTGVGEIGPKDLVRIKLGIKRKQLFLRKYIYPKAEQNKLLKFMEKKSKLVKDQKELASMIRDYLGINLYDLQNLSKKKKKAYIQERLEDFNFYVVETTYPYCMPEKISKDLEFSSMLIYDKYFPFMLMNTKEYDDDVEIFEPASRQILNMIFMLCAAGAKKYITNDTKKGLSDSEQANAYSLALEILFPNEFYNQFGIEFNYSNIEKVSKKTFLTPTAILRKLINDKVISDKKQINEIFTKIKETREKIKEKPKFFSKEKSPMSRFIRGYGKHNGVKFSRETVRIMRKNQDTFLAGKRVLFNPKRSTKKYEAKVQAYMQNFS